MYSRVRRSFSNPSEDKAEINGRDIARLCATYNMNTSRLAVLSASTPDSLQRVSISDDDDA